MNTLPLLRSVVLGALIVAASVHAEETGKVTQSALLERIQKQDQSVIILDVRSPEEFAAGHVPGAINIPYTHLPARISAIPSPTDKDVVVYCEIGVRAEKAVASLRDNGFTRLMYLDGDMKQWRESKRPTEK
jgi:rhodanese-related sulfurtransferase